MEISVILGLMYRIVDQIVQKWKVAYSSEKYKMENKMAKQFTKIQ